MAVQVERLVATLEARIDKYEKNLAKASRTGDQQFRRIEHRGEAMAKKLQTQFAGIATSFATAFAGGIVAGGFAGATRAIREIVSEASGLAKTADRIGVTTDEIQKLRYAGEIAGISIASMDKSLEQFTRRLGEAQKGTGTLRQILTDYNISLTDAQGNMRSVSSLLTDVSDAISNAGSAQERANVAYQAFGRSGVEMVLALRNGGDALQDMMRRADDLGLVIEERLLRRAEELDDKLYELTNQIQTGLKVEVLELSDIIESRFSQAAALATEMLASMGVQAETTAGWLASVKQALDLMKGGPIGAGLRLLGPADDEQPTEQLPETEVKPEEQPITIAPPKGGPQINPLRDLTDPWEPSRGARGSRGRSSGGGLKASLNDYQREVEQIRERTKAILAETAAMEGLDPLLDDYGYALEKARAEHELLTAAEQAGLSVDGELKATIEHLAAAYASAEVGAKQLAEAQDNVRQGAEDMRDLGRDALGGFISDLRSGKSAAEALENALNRLIDRMLDMALDSMFSGGGLFGGLFGGGGASSAVRAAAAAGAGGLFARGGVTRRPAIFGEAGPEAAVPLPDGRRIPVDLRLPDPVVPGGGGGSLNWTTHIDARGAPSDVVPQIKQMLAEERRNIERDFPRMLRQTQTRGKVYR